MLFTLTLITANALLSSAFAPSKSTSPKMQLKMSKSMEFAEIGGEPWDPMGFGNLKDVFDNSQTFTNMFPDKQFLQTAEIKHGRQCMLAWTGVWATTQGGCGLGMHIPGMPDEPDWTKALGRVAVEQPALFGAVVLFIAIAEGESVGHTGDNFRGKSTKSDSGDLNFDWLNLKKNMSPEKAERYRIAELKNGRLAMIAMASLFAFKSIPGSVPIMDILAPQ